MAVTFHPSKRDGTLNERGLDFADAEQVFEGVTVTFEDVRKNYGETRMVTIGALRGRMVVLGWTPRGDDRHVFTMRKPMHASRKNLGSDLRKVDARENTLADYDDLPEITDEEFARATVNYGKKPSRGRPPIGSGTKQQVTLRLDPQIQARFRSSGPGWQARMNDFLLRNEVVLKMIVEFDEFIGDMEHLIKQLENGGLRAVFEPADATIAKVERNIRTTKKTVRELREQLVWNTAETVAD